ncbi:hypothetical protein E1301_Tti006997 [Triplophysa tibetana]|uniref:Pre-B-cell leukemia transcription factor-interacting protein 1 Hematopoietic PBX-interacting protein n=1 Tax=Triplophysa tibetana TaxID=1572043 RepID=A0A5A9N2P9_9TELE|nr:hypothetical protein E1301_Tti006997 [Triplophysa tibetana]
MSANGNSASGNSWTLLTPEQTGVENVGPAAEGNKTKGDSDGLSAHKASTEVHTDLVKNSTEASARGQCDPDPGQDSEDTKEIHSTELPQVKHPETSESRAQLNTLEVKEDGTSVEDLSSWTPDHDEQDALTGHSESLDGPVTDADSFSDSYTHMSSTSGSSTHPASVCQGGEESHLKKTRTEDFKPDVELPEKKEKEGDGLRKRKITHLGSLDQGRTEAEDDEEAEEEEFQLPHGEDEKVFSLNKCILAALILLGLGTIFFSGVLMDPDDEGDIDVREFKDKANKEWLNSEVSRDSPVGPEPPDILSKQAKDTDEQIFTLHAQLQQHQGELKGVQHLVEEGEIERAKREELEKDYQRIQEELDRLPALQKELEQENEKMKEENERAKKELEALPSLHRELEDLRAQVSQLTQTTERAEHAHPLTASGMPSSGKIRNLPPIEPQDIKHTKHWDKKAKEREPSREEKEEKKKKSGKKDGKERREKVTEEERVKEQKDWKKDKSKEEEGKAGKSKDFRDEKEWKSDKKRGEGKIERGNEGKKPFKDRDEKTEWKEEKKFKKDKHEGQVEHMRDQKDWKDTGKKKVKEDKEKELKPRGERKDWKKEKEWNTDKKSDRKEKTKEGKEKDEWKGEKEWKKGKSEDKFNDKTEKKWKGGEKEFHKRFAEKEMEKIHLRGKERERSTDEDWKRDKLKDDKQRKIYQGKHEEKKRQNEEKQYKDEKERSNNERHRGEHPEQTSSHRSNDHQKQHHQINPENYWPRQRQKLQHNQRHKETCSGVAECAGVEGLSPVGLKDFEILLQSYLKKIQFPEERTSEKEEFSKLVREFFTDGLFVHDRMPFSEFVEDVADILEDMADGEESDVEESEEDDDDDDEEMEALEREAMEMFALPVESRKSRG